MKTWQAALIIIVLVIAAYSNTLFNGFVGDDNTLFINNTFYHDLKNLPRLLLPGYNYDAVNEFIVGAGDHGPGSVGYRPVDNATYFLDYALWKNNPFGFHLTNLMIHLINALLVFVLLLALLLPFPVALFSALLFALHPIQSEAVAAIGYRADSIACLWFLLALYCWVKNKFKASAIFYVLAVFSKESAIVFPLVAIAYDWFFRGRIMRFNIVFLGITFFYLYLYFFVFPNPAVAESTLLGEGILAHWGVVAKIYSIYFQAFFLPWEVTLIPSLYVPTIKSAAVEIGFVLIQFMALMACVIVLAKKYRQAGFFLCWFMVTIIPVLNIIPLPNPIAFRFMYLPSIGLLTIIAFLLYELLSKTRTISLRAPFFLQGLVLAICLISTITLNNYWKSTPMVALTWVEHYPQSWKANFLLGQLYFMGNEHDKSLPYFEKSLALGAGSRDFRVYQYLGEIYMQRQEKEKAWEYFNFILNNLSKERSSIWQAKLEAQYGKRLVK